MPDRADSKETVFNQKRKKKVQISVFLMNKQMSKNFRKNKTRLCYCINFSTLRFFFKNINRNRFFRPNIRRVLSQMHDGVFRSITFFSKVLTFAKCNYIIYDKKLLTMIRVFEIGKSELVSADFDKSIKTYTNHKNLKHFMITKQLNKRQVRGVEFLSKFNFKIMYRSKKQKKKSNALIKRAQNSFKKLNNFKKQHQYQTLLKNENIDKNIRKVLFVLFYDNKIKNHSNTNFDDNFDTESEAKIEASKISEITEKNLENTETIKELLKKAYEFDEIIQDIMKAKKKKIKKIIKSFD